MADRTLFTSRFPQGVDVGYRWYEKTAAKPLFPFGFGLSYTTLEQDQLKARGGKALSVSFQVTNTGAKAGPKSM